MKSATNPKPQTSAQSPAPLIRPIHCETASGQNASYGSDRGTIWLSFSHCKSRHSVIYATPNWKGGLARLREIISRHGINILPEHHALFGFEPEEAMEVVLEKTPKPGKLRKLSQSRTDSPAPKKNNSPIKRTLRIMAGRHQEVPAYA